MRLLFAAILLAVASGVAPAADKIDPALLVGKWEMPLSKDGKNYDGRMSVEFLADGTMKSEMWSGGTSEKRNGKYTLDGDKLRIDTKAGDREIVAISTVRKLTEKELVLFGQLMKETTFVRMNK
ncbi:lipocalin family protein [Zavarzinella formosa]|uniref:lipocalin family protein n=1 Tax=Zavarzinella formosa TaxID=360055 RepID=UPI0002DE89D8|nr:lipocalin family protein [Zavarzinella formosa]